MPRRRWPWWPMAPRRWPRGRGGAIAAHRLRAWRPLPIWRALSPLPYLGPDWRALWHWRAFLFHRPAHRRLRALACPILSCPVLMVHWGALQKFLSWIPGGIKRKKCPFHARRYKRKSWQWWPALAFMARKRKRRRAVKPGAVWGLGEGIAARFKKLPPPAHFRA